MRSLAVGSARLTLMNLGDLSYSLDQVISAPDEGKKRYGGLFGTKMPFPSQSVLVQTDGAPVLVDAGDFAVFAALSPEYSPKDYAPPPPLAKQLVGAGVEPDAIGTVVITHAHLDHYAGVTVEGTDGRQPLFRSARHLLGEKDWESKMVQEPLADPDSPESRTLGVLRRLNLLDLTSGERSLSDSLSIIPTPGESPGHQVLRVSSEGEVAYCVGDLFHHFVEVENPSWMAEWCDQARNEESRGEILRSAEKEGALIVAAHMPPGRVSRGESGFEFTAE